MSDGQDQDVCHALTGQYHCRKCGECVGFLGCAACEPGEYARAMTELEDDRLLQEYRSQQGLVLSDERGRPLSGVPLLEKLRDMAHGRTLWGTKDYWLWLHEDCTTTCSWCYPPDKHGNPGMRQDPARNWQRTTFPTTPY